MVDAGELAPHCPGCASAIRERQDVNLLTGRTCTDPWHVSATLCRAQYPQFWTGSYQSGTRIVRCTLPAGHTGDHEEVETESSWRNHPSIEQLGHLDVLRLEPGDTLVFTVQPDMQVTGEWVARIQAQLAKAFPDHKNIIIGGGTLGVIRTGTSQTESESGTQ